MIVIWSNQKDCTQLPESALCLLCLLCLSHGLGVHTLCTGVKDAMAEVLALQDFLYYVVSIHPCGINSFELILHWVLLYWMSKVETEAQQNSIRVGKNKDIRPHTVFSGKLIESLIPRFVYRVESLQTKVQTRRGNMLRVKGAKKVKHYRGTLAGVGWCSGATWQVAEVDGVVLLSPCWSLVSMMLPMPVEVEPPDALLRWHRSVELEWIELYPTETRERGGTKKTSRSCFRFM